MGYLQAQAMESYRRNMLDGESSYNTTLVYKCTNEKDNIASWYGYRLGTQRQLSLFQTKDTEHSHTALAASPPPDSKASCLAFPRPIPPCPTPILLATYR